MAAPYCVSKYMSRRGRPPSQTWKTFLRNHADAIAAVDMCVVPTLTFDRLFAILVLSHDRRQLLWFEVTRHRSLRKDAPLRRVIQQVGTIVAIPILGWITSPICPDMIFGKDKSDRGAPAPRSLASREEQAPLLPQESRGTALSAVANTSDKG